MGLQRKCHLGDIYEQVEVNVYDIFTKEIVFTGSQVAAGFFIGVGSRHILSAARSKSRIKKKYAVRIKSTKTE